MIIFSIRSYTNERSVTINVWLWDYNILIVSNSRLCTENKNGFFFEGLTKIKIKKTSVYYIKNPCAMSTRRVNIKLYAATRVKRRKCYFSFGNFVFVFGFYLVNRYNNNIIISVEIITLDEIV